MRPPWFETTIFTGERKNVTDIWENERWRLDQTTITINQHIREQFFYRRPLAAERLLEEIKKIKVFGYVQCDIEAHENLR